MRDNGINQNAVDLRDGGTTSGILLPNRPIGEAESSLVFAYTYDWTKMRPGTPNPKGFAPYPDALYAIAVNNGNGGFFLEKEKAFSVNAELRVFLTDCTDPVKCWRVNLIGSYATITPGSITQNTDWASGGLGKATRTGFGGNITWGASRWAGDIGLEVMWFSTEQDLPCNNAGIASLAVCGTPTTRLQRRAPDGGASDGGAAVLPAARRHSAKPTPRAFP